MDTRAVLDPIVPARRPPGRRYPGWRVVGACFVIATFGWGLGFYGPGVYMAELRAGRAWSVSLIAGATTVYYLMGAALIVVVPDLIRRFGQRAAVLTGAAAMSLSVGTLPLIAAPWQLVAAYLLMAVGWASLSSTAITTILAPWFVRRRGLAISLAFNGASCSGVIVVPILVLLNQQLGFVLGVLLVIATLLLLLVPAVLVGLRWPGPEAIGWTADGDTSSAPSAARRPDPEPSPRRSELLRSRAFWGVAVPFALALVAQVGFLTHQITFLGPHLGAAGAGFAVALTTAAAVTGRLVLGLVVDRLDRRRVAAATFASQAVALLAMAVYPGQTTALYLSCLVFGFSVGNVITLPALVVQQEFPAAAFATVIALSTAISQLTWAFGPGLIGVLRDLAGGYGVALALCALVDIAAAAIIESGRPRR